MSLFCAHLFFLFLSSSIVVAFTIEADQTKRGTAAAAAADGEYVVRKPIRGLLTNHGYCVPDPDVPNRLSVWFSGGALELQDEEGVGDAGGGGASDTSSGNLEEWRQVFDSSTAPPRDLREYARVLAARVLLGARAPETMADDGCLSYRLGRPIGGHGECYTDVLYSDPTFRVVRGHHGSIYVFSKVPGVAEEGE